MDKENSPKVKRRTTRASASTTPSKNILPNHEEFEDMDKENSPQVKKKTTRASASTKSSKNTITNQEEFEDVGEPNFPQVKKRKTRASASTTPSKNTLPSQEESDNIDEENSPQVQKRTTRASASTTPSKNTLLDQEEPGDMDEENSPRVPKRTTRTSAATTPSKSTLPNQKKADHHPQSLLDNLVYRDQQGVIGQDKLFSTFPGRKSQILELLRLFGPINSSLLPIFLYGGPSSGKTSIILHIFKHLKRPFIYASCRTCHSPRLLFESVLNQLLLHRKDSSNAYSSAKRCEKPADFVNLLRESLMGVINSLKVNSRKSGLKESGEQGIGRMVYIIFDNMELVRDWDKDSVIISMLFKLYDILKMPEVGLIFVSSNSPDTYHLNTGSVEPIPIHFPEYTEDDLCQIFLRNQRDPKLYSSFLDVVLKDSCKITRCIDELSTYFKLLFEKYCEPLSGVGRVPNQDMKSKLYMHLKPHVTSSLNEVFRVPSCPALELKENKEKVRKKRNMRSLGDGVAPDDIDFHMSVSAKYLLISTFLASRNPATLDAALFDSAGGGDNRKRRKKSETSIQQKENAEQELLMKGPGTFPLERLLAIFQCITSVTDDVLDDEQQEVDVMGTEGGENGLMSDVLLQLSTLCNANIIIKGGNCPLDGSSRYRSTVSEEMALKVARSVNFPLHKYLYRK